MDCPRILSSFQIANLLKDAVKKVTATVNTNTDTYRKTFLFTLYSCEIFNTSGSINNKKFIG